MKEIEEYYKCATCKKLKPISEMIKVKKENLFSDLLDKKSDQYDLICKECVNK